MTCSARIRRCARSGRFVVPQLLQDRSYQRRRASRGPGLHSGRRHTAGGRRDGVPAHVSLPEFFSPLLEVELAFRITHDLSVSLTVEEIAESSELTGAWNVPTAV